jgi:hypothetical protein
MADIGQSIEIRSRLTKRTKDKLDNILMKCVKRMEYKKGASWWINQKKNQNKIYNLNK